MYCQHVLQGLFRTSLFSVLCSCGGPVSTRTEKFTKSFSVLCSCGGDSDKDTCGSAGITCPKEKPKVLNDFFTRFLPKSFSCHLLHLDVSSHVPPTSSSPSRRILPSRRIPTLDVSSPSRTHLGRISDASPAYLRRIPPTMFCKCVEKCVEDAHCASPTYLLRIMRRRYVGDAS